MESTTIQLAVKVLVVNLLALSSILYFTGFLETFHATYHMVWKVPPLKHGEGGPKVPIAATDMGYTLACVPTPEAEQYCQDMARVDVEPLHYVELLFRGKVMDSFCTKHINHLPKHIQHVCNYRKCTTESCVPMHVFDIHVALEGMEGEENCRRVAFELSYSGSKVDKVYECKHKGTPQECHSESAQVIVPSQKQWKQEKHVESRCTIKPSKSAQPPRASQANLDLDTTK